MLVMRLSYGSALFLLAAACGDNIRPANPDVDAPRADAPIDTPVMCEPNEVVCDGDDLVTCDANGMEGTREDCALGCNSDATPPRCNIPVISNLPTDTCSTGGTAPLEVAAGATLEVSTADAMCDSVVTQGPNLPKICVKKYTTVTIAATATVNVTGPNALAIVSTGAMTVDGTIDVSAAMAAHGPGAPQMQGAGAAPPMGASAGGGGAGFLTPGGDGGDSAIRLNQMGGAGGMMHGTDELIPLHAGARGGNGGTQNPTAQGGFAGGALQLGSCTSITMGMMAVIDAGGGGGQGGNGAINSAVDPGGGAGGGSGGAILVEAPVVTVAGGLFANGGGGGSGGAHGTAMTPGQDGNRGADGPRSTMPAAGGPGVILPGNVVTGAGGDGGARDEMPTAGAQPTASLIESSGGGGGAAGRIRINVADMTEPTLTDAQISPMPTVGVMGKN